MDDYKLYCSLTGRMSTDEDREVLGWRAESPENERRYRQLARILELADATQSLPRSSPLSGASVRSAANARVRRTLRWAPGRRALRWVGALAAAIALMLIGYSFHGKDLQRSPAVAFGAEEFVAGADDSTIELRDGSVIRLAPKSRLQVTSIDESREVSIQGRGYFAVATQEGRPFRVRTTAGTVTVLGTRFDLQVDGEDLQLIVVEGQVAVAAKNSRTQVSAGEMVRVIDGTALPVVRVPEATRMTDWKGNFLVFQATPLRQAITEIQHQYGVVFDVADSVLLDREITTWFADANLDAVIKIVCMTIDAQCTRNDRVVEISSHR